MLNTNRASSAQRGGSYKSSRNSSAAQKASYFSGANVKRSGSAHQRQSGSAHQRQSGSAHQVGRRMVKETIKRTVKERVIRAAGHRQGAVASKTPSKSLPTRGTHTGGMTKLCLASTMVPTRTPSNSTKRSSTRRRSIPLTKGRQESFTGFPTKAKGETFRTFIPRGSQKSKTAQLKTGRATAHVSKKTRSWKQMSAPSKRSRSSSGLTKFKHGQRKASERRSSYGASASFSQRRSMRARRRKRNRICGCAPFCCILWVLLLVLILCLGIFLLWPAGDSETEQETPVEPKKDGSIITPPPKHNNKDPPKKPKISWPWEKPDKRPSIEIPPGPTPVKPSEPGFFANVWNHIELYWFQYACVFGMGVLWYFWESPAPQRNPQPVITNDTTDEPENVIVTDNIPDSVDPPEEVPHEPSCLDMTHDEIRNILQKEPDRLKEFCHGHWTNNHYVERIGTMPSWWYNEHQKENPCCPFKAGDMKPGVPSFPGTMHNPVPEPEPELAVVQPPTTCQEEDKPQSSLLASIPIIGGLVPNQDWYVKDADHQCVGPGPQCMRCPSKAGQSQYDWTTPGQICAAG